MVTVEQALLRRVGKAGTILRRFAREECGQDVIEYALITALFGIVGVLVLQGIETAVASTYDAWQNPNVGVQSLWTPNEP